ncbi:MAG: hypothetical protein GY910_15570 [bacterium]|nr:hypothetical protein [bacterium]
MPEIEGVEFLRRFRELNPRALRILVIAHGDAKILGEAINDGNIDRCVAKPWEPDDLRLTVQRAIEVYALAAGLAHEINNPLVCMNTLLSLAPEKREVDDASFWGDYRELACGELDRIRGLVETMSRLGRGGQASLSPAERSTPVRSRARSFACSVGRPSG